MAKAYGEWENLTPPSSNPLTDHHQNLRVHAAVPTTAVPTTAVPTTAVPTIAIPTTVIPTNWRFFAAQ